MATQTKEFTDNRKGPVYKTFLLLMVIGFPALITRQLLIDSVSVIYLLLFYVLYIICASGVTIGLHRYFTHNSFKAKRGVKIALAVLASLALEGPIITWVSNHRLHHQYSDKNSLDPHSPWKNKWVFQLKSISDEPETILQIIAGLLYSHVGWIFVGTGADPEKYAPDLLKDDTIVWFSKFYFIWIIATFLIPSLLGGIFGLLFHIPFITGTLQGLLWGGVARIVLVHHVTWSVNSICHVWGKRPYNTSDHSGNVFWLFLPTLGESFHNNHHKFPWSARHGTSGWDDPSYAIIKLMERLGWVYNVSLPNKEN